jgi:hypothetical protein
MGGMPFLLIFYVISVTISVIKSKARTKTVLYSLGGVAVMIALGFLLSLAVPSYGPVLGTVTAPVCIATGMLVGIKHSHDTQKTLGKVHTSGFSRIT